MGGELVTFVTCTRVGDVYHMRQLACALGAV